MAKAPAGLKRCPDCEELIGEWRDVCECGHVFFVREAVDDEPRAVRKRNPTIEESPGELEGLIEAIQTGKPAPTRRAPTVARQVAPLLEETPRPARRQQPEKPKSGAAFKIVLGLFLLVVVILGIVDFPLQTIAACAVIGVIFAFFRPS